MIPDRAFTFLLLVAAWLPGFSGLAAAAEEPPVVITGGADDVGHNYAWKVTNRYRSPIVRIEFPHYAADLFHTPAGWSQGTQAEMNLVNVGWKDEPGVCVATPAPPSPGLAPGVTAEFGMRIASRGAMKGTGTIRVTFADGTSVQVAGVQLPEMPTRPSPYLGLVAMGAILLIFIVVRETRRRKQPAPAGVGPLEDDSDQS